MASQEIDDFTELAEGPALADLLVLVDTSDTTDSPQGTTKKNKAQYGLGNQVNAQTGTTYTYLTTDFRKLVTHTNASAIAGTLPQAGASFPAGWWMIVQNRGAGALTITPTTSTIDGAATLVLNQNEGAFVASDGTNYFTFRGKATGGSGGVGDVVGPGSATDNALVRFDSTTGKLIQDSTVTLDDTGALTVPEMAAPATPAAGKVSVYAKADGKLYIKDDAGTETDLTATGAGGAETGANSDITSMDGLTGSLRAPTQIEDSNGNEVLKFGSTASAVNEVTVTNKATGNAPTIAATGGDTDVSLNLVSKGAGVVQANGVNVLLETLEVFASDLTTALTTGTGKGVFFMPYAMTVTEVFAGLATPQTSGSTFTVDINEGGTTILSTKITIDNTEDTSLTAATPPVISDAALAKGAKMTVDIDQIGDGTAKGLVVVISGVRG